MIYLYNTASDSYKDLYRSAYNTLVEYLAAEEEDTTSIKVLFVISLDDIFTKAKKNTAYRARFAKDNTGASLLKNFEITDDERDFFDDIMKTGGAEVFNKLSAWTKTIEQAYKYNVSFGLNSSTGSIESVDGATITDSTLNLSVNNLTGHKLVITSEGDFFEQEREVVSNTANTITLDEPFIGDITGQTFKTFNASDRFILYDVNMQDDWMTNMVQGAEAAIKEALTAFFVKEWYLINRMLDDAQIEAARYTSELNKIRDYLNRRVVRSRRSGELFS